VNDLDSVRAALITARNNFIAKNLPANADKQVGRALGRFALVAAAGELAIALGVLPWPEGEATQGSGICFRAWVEQRGGTGSTEIAAGLAKVRKFFELHGESRFTPWDGAIADRPTSIARDCVGSAITGLSFTFFPRSSRLKFVRVSILGCWPVKWRYAVFSFQATTGEHPHPARFLVSANDVSTTLAI
jgi:hypothetical protein